MDNSNLEEYKYPEFYDLENADFEPEGSFYLSIARTLGGPVKVSRNADPFVVE